MQKVLLEESQNWQHESSLGRTQLKKKESGDLDFLAFSSATYHIFLDKYDAEEICADKCFSCQLQFRSPADKVDPHNFKIWPQATKPLQEIHKLTTRDM